MAHDQQDATNNGSDAGSRSNEAREVLIRYLEALERFDIEAAAACFTEDVEYSHAPFRHLGDTGRRVARGRAELLKLFQIRGPRSIKHDYDVAAANGNRCFVSGFVFDGDVVEASFISDFELSPDGLIASYVGYSTAPAARLHAPVEGGPRLPWVQQ